MSMASAPRLRSADVEAVHRKEIARCRKCRSRCRKIALVVKHDPKEQTCGRFGSRVGVERSGRDRLVERALGRREIAGVGTRASEQYEIR